MIRPFFHDQRVFDGMTFGLGPCGYDVRVDQDVTLLPGDFALASTIEQFNMPHDLMARVCDKSTWARRGLFVQNTVIEPGWRGHLTLELSLCQTCEAVTLRRGAPVAQVLFEELDRATDAPYRGKYQDQEAGPQPARVTGEFDASLSALNRLRARFGLDPLTTADVERYPSLKRDLRHRWRV